jgi:hypothetical protein
MKKILLVLFTHTAMIAVGFAAGVYMLPIIIAPPAPDNAEVQIMAARAEYSGEFRRDLKGSDFLHWGEGMVSIGRDGISLQGKLAPGPDYKLYLSPEFVETGDEFLGLKNSMVRIGDVKTFQNFIVPMPPSVDPDEYNTVIVWCEAFDQFITAAQYQ